MDNTLRVWDIRPFVTKEILLKFCRIFVKIQKKFCNKKKDRLTKMFVGHKHNFEKNLLKCAWSPDDSKVTCGSADRYTLIVISSIFS